MSGGQTPSQTAGPFFAMRLGRDEDAVMADATTPGQPIVVTGVLLDGNRDPIEDGLIEVWQADAEGRYRHPLDDRGTAGDFTGFGRARTGFEDGTYTFRTIKPGPVPGPDGGLQAPHLNVVVQGRGMLNPSFTRIYFSDEADANAADLVVAMVPEARRDTLVAVLDDTPRLASPLDTDGVPTYRFDIRFQGDDETVFLDF